MYLRFSRLICKVTDGSISILVSMIPTRTDEPYYISLVRSISYFDNYNMISKTYFCDASPEVGSFKIELSECFSLEAAVASASYTPKTNS